MPKSLFQYALLLAIGIGIFAPAAEAVLFLNTNNFVLAQDASLDEETWMYAADVTVAGTAENDFFLLAEKIVCSGTFEKSAWMLGDEITLNGDAQDDARLAARSVTVDGHVAGDLIACGNDVRVTSNAVVVGSSVVLAENAVIVGAVQGGLQVTSYEVTLGGEIHGDVFITAGDIVVLPDTIIDGDLDYRSSKELFLDKSVVHSGALRRVTVAKKKSSLSRSIVTQASFLFGALALGLPFMVVFSRLTNHSIHLLRHEAWRCGLVGMITFCIVPTLAFLAFFTIFGIPFSVALLLFAGSLVMVSKIVVALTLGSAVMRYRGTLSFRQGFSALFIGLFFIYICGLVPGLGETVWLATAFFGLGAIVLVMFGGRIVALPPPPQPKDQSFPKPGNDIFDGAPSDDNVTDRQKE